MATNYYGNPPYNSANIKSNLTFKPLYSTQQTQESANQQHANAMQAGTPAWLMKQFGGGGFRRGPGTMAAAMPQITGAQLAASLVGPQQQFQDTAANEQHRLGVEQSQFGDSMGQLGNLTALRNPMQQGGQNIIQSLLMSLLS